MMSEQQLPPGPWTKCRTEGLADIVDANGNYIGTVDAAVADLMLRAERESDQAVITESWLESIGFQFDRDAGIHQGFISTGGDLSLFATRHLEYDSGPWERFEWKLDLRWLVKTPRNRGELRNLARVLGITLKEGV